MLIWSSSYNIKIDTEFVAPFIMYGMCVNGTWDHLNQWHGGQSIKWKKHILIRESQYICTRLNYKWSFAWISWNKWHTTCFWMFKLCHKLVLYWNSIMFPHKAHHQLETPITFLLKKKKPPSPSVLGFASEKSAEISRATRCIMYYTKNYIENIQW